jgi:microcystin-dependent protein
MSTTYTPLLGLAIPSRGTDPYDLYLDGGNSVGANNNYTLIDSAFSSVYTAFGGATTVTVSDGVTVTLTLTQANTQILIVEGNITGSLATIVYPANTGGRRIVLMNANITTGAGVGVDIVSAGDTAHGCRFPGSYPVPLGIMVLPSRVYWDYGSAVPGDVMIYPRAAHAVPIPGWQICDGSLLDSTWYDLLFNIIGTDYGGSGSSFAVPDYRGYVDTTADDFYTLAGSANRLPAPWTGSGTAAIIGTAQHTMLAAEIASHTHTATQASHTHLAADGNQTQVITTVSGDTTGFTSGGRWGNENLALDTQTPVITVAPFGSATPFNLTPLAMCTCKFIRV